tara:strand:- start:746 stop:886 length:141 start_codon:yes stop_codon:yes gene_type:complete
MVSLGLFVGVVGYTIKEVNPHDLMGVLIGTIFLIFLLLSHHEVNEK